MNIEELEQKAKWIRSQCIKMSYNAKEGHLGSALSCADILVAIYDHFNFDPFDPERDRLYFSKGHAASALYATMASFGIIYEDALDCYAQPGSVLTPHPDKRLFEKLEMSSGSLGHGLGVACGAAYALKQRGSTAKCIVLLGDGECNEGSVWEAAQFAVSHELDNLLVVVDYNRIQSIGRTDTISGHTNLLRKFKAFGWGGWHIDGHNYAEWDDRLIRLRHEVDMPMVVVAQTVAGAGVSFMEEQSNTCLWHYRVPSEEEVQVALEELNA